MKNQSNKNTSKSVKKKTVASKNSNSKTNAKKNVIRRKKSKKDILKTLLKIGLVLFLIMFIVGVVVAIIFFNTIIKEAPDFDPQNLFTQESSIVYSAEGTEIAKLGTEKREKVAYNDLPQVLIDAIVATEDSTFFQHNGFNAARFLKASLSQVFGGGGGGASTLTMQVSKNAYTSNVSSGFEGIKRKFTDIYLSIFKIEKAYTKEEILEFYVNSYYMGDGAYGVEQACQNYFGKSVRNINLAEAAMLAGIYQAPVYYDPTLHPENTEERRQTVLNLMVRHGYITKEERDIASKLSVDKIVIKKNNNDNDQLDPRYKDFIDTVVADVKNKTGYDPYSTPMLIYSTMDAGKQEYVTNLMKGNNYTWENDKVQAGIAVIDNNSGALVAVGANRLTEGANSWNYATMNRRQIGSTAKPLYDYGPLIEYNNASTYHLFYDEPYTYTGGGTINNWDGGYNKFVTMREALRVSRNIPALKAFQENNNANILDFATKIGLSPEAEGGFVHEAHSIGAYGDAKTTGENPLTLAAAYSTFANGGYYTEPYTFTKIIYRNSDEVYEYKPVTTKVMSAETAYMVADMLVTTSGWAAGTSSVNGVSVGTKSGTTNYSTEIMNKYHMRSNAVNDLWYAGICRDYATAVWYGYDELSSEFYNTMSNPNPKNLYKTLISGVFNGTPSFSRPSGVVSVTIEKESPGNGLLPSPNTPSDMLITELFRAGTEPTSVSSRYASLGNVSNLTGSIQNNKIVLSWSGISTPDSLNSEKLTELYSPVCKNVNACVNEILNSNKSRLGNVIYEVYLRSDNKDVLLKRVDGVNVSLDIPSGVGNKATIVVKSAYTNFSAATSSGVSVDIDVSGHGDSLDITAAINGKNTISDVTSYKDEFVTVLEGSKDVTSLATIKVFVNDTLQEKNLVLNSPGTYNIKYEVSYKNFKKVMTRTVTIKNN